MLRADYTLHTGFCFERARGPAREPEKAYGIQPEAEPTVCRERRGESALSLACLGHPIIRCIIRCVTFSTIL